MRHSPKKLQNQIDFKIQQMNKSMKLLIQTLRKKLESRLFGVLKYLEVRIYLKIVFTLKTHTLY